MRSRTLHWLVISVNNKYFKDNSYAHHIIINASYNYKRQILQVMNKINNMLFSLSLTHFLSLSLSLCLLFYERSSSIRDLLLFSCSFVAFTLLIRENAVNYNRALVTGIRLIAFPLLITRTLLYCDGNVTWKNTIVPSEVRLTYVSRINVTNKSLERKASITHINKHCILQCNEILIYSINYDGAC